MNTMAWKFSAAQLEQVPCPLCGGTQFTALANTDRYDMDLATVGCEGCGFVLTNPQPTAQALDGFYTLRYRDFYQKTAKPSIEYIRQYRKDDRARYTAEFLQAAGALSPGARVLDIGAAEGCILKALRDLDTTLQADAVEPNPDFGAFAREHAGCTVFPTLERLRQERPARYTLIVINHVLEHMKQPVAYLASLQDLLLPGGQIYIDVPSIADYDGLGALHVAHLCHFSETTLRWTAELAGYDIVRMERHAPVMHPLSIRCLLLPGTPRKNPLAPASCEGWDRVRSACRNAWRFHRKRWNWGRRLGHLLQSLIT